MDKENKHVFGQGPGELFESEYNKPLPMRLDRWLVSQRAEQSRAHIQKFIEAGLAKVNGKTGKAKTPVRPGDIIQLWIPPPEPLPYLKPEEIDLDVLYEDDHLIVINKTAGIAVHPEDNRYKHLIGKKAVLPIVGREITVVGDNYADPEKGTGAVKITPAHDFNDFQVGKRHNLQVINILKEDGRLNNNVPEEYQGLSIFQAREMIVKSISDLGLLDKIEDTIHTVPYGDRSNTVIEPFLTDQWFVDAKKLALPAINAVKNKETIFVPKSWENTFFEWMNNIEPWCISRQLWWGHRIPAWHSDKGDIFVAKSEKEAEDQAKDKYGELPYILKQDSDVLDTWFSSGLWPFSTLDWPKKVNI